MLFHHAIFLQNIYLSKSYFSPCHHYSLFQYFPTFGAIKDKNSEQNRGNIIVYAYAMVCNQLCDLVIDYRRWGSTIFIDGNQLHLRDNQL